MDILLPLPDNWPAELSANVQNYYQQITDIPNKSQCRQSLARVCAASEFVAKTLVRQPTLLTTLFDQGDIKKRFTQSDYLNRWQTHSGIINTLNELMHQLRLFRQGELVRLIWREITQVDNISQTLQQLSALAEVCIDVALQQLYSWQCNQYGTPYDKQGEPMQLIVLSLGKLGGYELNLSSDVDLQFLYAHQGDVTHANQSITLELFFNRLAQTLTKVLSETTQDGFVYRVDMRLRPFGSSGPLVNSIPSLLAYYQEHGRDWERYALVKARVISGHGYHAQHLETMLRRFVYRRYIDYSILDGLRAIKQQIDREARSQNLQQHIKLGKGGIREIEFIVQAFQIIRAAKDPRLQSTNLINVMPLLVKTKCLPKLAVKQLWQAYQFLRRVENALQAVNDQQTHTLPSDPIIQFRICLYCGFDQWSQLIEQLHYHQQYVIEHFKHMIGNQPQHFSHDQHQHIHDALQAIWLEHTEQYDILIRIGFSNPQHISQLLATFRGSYRFRKLSTLARSRINKLMPILLMKVTNTSDPSQTLVRTIRLLEAIIQRSAYIALLIENPMMLSRLIELIAQSEWIAKQLANYPVVLDELLAPFNKQIVPTVAMLTDSLNQQIKLRDDPEEQIEHLRHFKHSHNLRVAASDLMDKLPLMRVSDYLTNLATAILHATVTLVKQQLITRHGYPIDTHGKPIDDGLLIIAYGKLGGIELSYTSDLDLVFLHASVDEQQYTNGTQPISNSLFYTRLAQRLLNTLNVRTNTGVLYTIDTRLRPAGKAGLLHNTLTTFANYQQQTAWTWEHQALVRARPVYGDPQLAKQFWQLRRTILTLQRDHNSLRQDILDMRSKLSQTTTTDPVSMLKRGPGGLTDIEFLVQYAVLRWAHAHPELVAYTDNMRLLACLQRAGKLTDERAHILMDAYCCYRKLLHQHSLTQHPITADLADLQPHITAVKAQWLDWIGN